MLNEREVADSVLSGVLKANEKYERWSGGMSVAEAGIEPLLCVEVGRHLLDRGHTKHKNNEALVTFETDAKSIVGLSDPQERKPGPRRAGGIFSGKTKRLDIVYYRRSGHPVGTIEVKRQWNRQHARADFDRIHEMLDYAGLARKGKLRWGCCASFAYVKRGQQKTINMLLEDVVKFARSLNDDESNGVRVRAYTKLRDLDDLPPDHPHHGWRFGASCLFIRQNPA